MLQTSGSVSSKNCPSSIATTLHSRLDESQDITSLFDLNGFECHAVVGSQLLGHVTDIDGMLENVNILTSDLGSADAADQLLGFAAEHAAANDLDPTVPVVVVYHGGLLGPLHLST